MKNITLLLSLLALAFSASGCLSPVDSNGRIHHKQFDVSISSLDWINIGYFPEETDLEIFLPCRMSISGAGYIEFFIGRSPRVWNAFSDDVNNPYWNHIVSGQRSVDTATIQNIFQTYVDEGIFPRNWIIDKKLSSNIKAPYIKAHASVGFFTSGIVTDNKNLVDVTKEILLNFQPEIEAARRMDRNYNR